MKYNSEQKEHGTVYNTIDKVSSLILKFTLYTIFVVILVCLSPLLILLMFCGISLGETIRKGMTGK